MSEIKYSMLNDDHRIDAEYFGKNILDTLEKLSDFGTLKIGDIANVTDGIHDSIDYDENSPINLISATSPKENVFDLSRGAFISEKAHKQNPRTALRKNDVIISTVGTIGNCAVVDDSILPANSDRHVGIIRIKNDYSPYVLSTFLLSKYGKIQTSREATGNVQLNLFIYKLKELEIPQFFPDFQSKIE
ncbi:restriction endonuclease subunit S [uncultured Treponema sp.]|uniref:restriction endonuclease subunit S n=1 Tax=uncultured Treponema sp. TaxID=162155 RepID=UPI002804EBCF|nr:restriction endonuclease subunit S [uncultured Treponema sp.]